MKLQITSAEFERYNANNRGNNSPDCVKRAISLAFDTPYAEVSKLLNNKMKELRAYAWNITPVFSKVISDLGGGKRTITEHSGTTVDSFADDHPSGAYILLTGPKEGSTSHLVTVREGRVWDSWDSRKNFVQSYWKVENGSNRQIRDTSKNYMESVGNELAVPVVHDEIIRYMDKKKWSYSDATTQLIVSKYQILVKCKIKLNKDDLILKDRDYSFNVILVIEPSWTDVEIVEFIKKIGKQRAYDRMWTINEQEKKLREGAEIQRQLDSNPALKGRSTLYTTEQEDRFLNTLPGWARPLVGDIQIQEPGKYIDSYRLKMYKLPQDDRHPDIRFFYLEGETASDIRRMLDEYKNGYNIEGIDYSYWDKY